MNEEEKKNLSVPASIGFDDCITPITAGITSLGWLSTKALIISVIIAAGQTQLMRIFSVKKV